MTAEVIFQPWVGPHYHQSPLFGMRILVLGESHYGDEDEPSDFTARMVQEYAIDSRLAFFTKITKLLLGLDASNDLSDEARKQCWENIAFYNFVQVMVGYTSRKRPTAEMWQAAKAPFQQVVAQLQPDLILVLGKKLADYVPEVDPAIEICRVYHPSSSSFTYKMWIEALNTAKANVLARQQAVAG